MDTKKGIYKYTDYNDQKCLVPIQRVSSLSQLKRGDHIARKGFYGFCWHHAIVEDVSTEGDIINVIEYSSSVKDFLKDVISLKNPGKAKVTRGNNRLGDGFYLIDHETCQPAELVLEMAVRKLGERKYHLSKNNCEHFAMWCKIRISSSEQVKTMEEILKTTLPLVATATVTYAAESLWKRAWCAGCFEVAFAAYRINRAKEDLRANKISPNRYDDTISELIVVGVIRVVGSTAGATAGQYLIPPYPVAGSIVGSLVGRLVGQVCGDKLWNALSLATSTSFWARAWQINEL